MLAKLPPAPLASLPLSPAPLLRGRGLASLFLYLLVVACDFLLVIACDQDGAPSAATTPTPVVEAEAAVEAVPGEAEVVSAARLQRSIELEQKGDLEAARVEAEAAMAMDGGRDAKLQVAKLAILGQRYDDAVTVLEPLVQADATDAAAQYNLALVRQHQGDYNRARNGYLAALRSDPRYADARYNLAVLCLGKGFRDEAKHHVERFRASFPDDARGPELERRIGGTGAAGPSGAPPSTLPPTPAPPPAPTP
jgi:tetratricopeptide (TPR) repeat protein